MGDSEMSRLKKSIGIVYERATKENYLRDLNIFKYWNCISEELYEEALKIINSGFQPTYTVRALTWDENKERKLEGSMDMIIGVKNSNKKLV